MILRDNDVKKLYLLNITRTKMTAFFRIPYQSTPTLKEQRYSVHSLIQVISKATVLMYGYLFHTTVKMGVIIFKALILDKVDLLSSRRQYNQRNTLI